MSIVKKLESRGFTTPPPFVSGSVQYEVMMGSVAYGVSDDTSDMDVYGFCVPPRHVVFPHLNGEILGFGRHKKRFEQWQQHHIHDPDALGGRGRDYDFQIFSIVKYFHLCMENNPNMIDSLFVPDRCVITSTKIGAMVRENGRIFLHKGAWHRFKGYAFSQVKKMMNKNPQGKRLETVQKYGYDTKFAYHVVRLLDEVEQILSGSDIDLTRDRERLKSIRRGEWTAERIKEFFEGKEKALEKLYETSKIPYAPDEEKIKQLLLNCLEEFYGNLEKCITRPDWSISTLRQITEIMDNVRPKLM